MPNIQGCPHAAIALRVGPLSLLPLSLPPLLHCVCLMPVRPAPCPRTLQVPLPTPTTPLPPPLLPSARHYTFYLWRRLLARTPAARYALAPVYAGCWALLLHGLLERVSRLWVLGFVACLAATLVPAWLLELR